MIKVNPSMDNDLLHIGIIKRFFDSKGYGFIIDFSDNQEYFFHSSSYLNNSTSERIVVFKLKESKKYPDQLEAIQISSIPFQKNILLQNFNKINVDYQQIIKFFLPSLNYKENPKINSFVENLLLKYENLIRDLYEYVCNFEIEKLLAEYSVKTSFYYSASTKDWDTNSLDYVSVIPESFNSLESIYKRCLHYEEELVWEYYQVSQNWHMFKVFDFYLSSLVYRSKEIKSTTAYGRDTRFWDNLDEQKINKAIPDIREQWIKEIREEYNKVNHFNKLLEPLSSRFYDFIKRLPMVINEKGEEDTYISTSHFDILFNFNNGEIKFRSTSYIGDKGYGWELTRFYNKEKSFFSKREGVIEDEDFNNLVNDISEKKRSYGNKFRELMKKYQDKLR